MSKISYAGYTSTDTDALNKTRSSTVNVRPSVMAPDTVRVAAFTADWVASQVAPLVRDPARLAAMSAAASGLIPRDADEKLARIVLEVGA